jgi:hypothetical protein
MASMNTRLRLNEIIIRYLFEIKVYDRLPEG